MSWGTALAPSTGWIRGKLVSVSAARLAGPNGFAELGVSGYYPSHTPQTPALVSRELGDSRRALTCPGVAMCLAGPSRSLQVARRAALTPCHEAGSECVVRYGGRWSALKRLRWATAWPDPAAGQPEPEAGIRRRNTAAGPGGGTTLGEGHRWRHRPSSRLGDGRPALPLVSANTTSEQSRLGVVLSFPRWPARTLEEGT